jgi:hypothetical protein
VTIKAIGAKMAIDWREVAASVGGFDLSGNERTVGTDGGRRAVEILLGEENLRDAVDHFVLQLPGAYTVEMFLKIISSEVAMKRCLEIYKTEPNPYRACSAVFLLGSMADYKALSWVGEFLSDSNEAVRLNGLRVLQNILYGPLDDEDIATARKLFDKAESDPDATVRERATSIRQHSVLRS